MTQNTSRNNQINGIPNNITPITSILKGSMSVDEIKSTRNVKVAEADLILSRANSINHGHSHSKTVRPSLATLENGIEMETTTANLTELGNNVHINWCPRARSEAAEVKTASAPALPELSRKQAHTGPLLRATIRQ